MSLTQHTRYGYTPILERPVYDWPDGHRLAVYIAVNIETFPFGEGLGPDLNPRQPEPDVVNHGWRDWGNRVGIWNLLEVLDHLSLPVAALTNTAVYDHHPQIIRALRSRGDEIIGHGRTNAERACDFSPQAEAAMIEACVARIASEEGRKPTGWMSPWVNQSISTPDFLAAAGLRYTLDWPMDDQPIRMQTAHGPLWALPYARSTNDISALHGAKTPPRQWVETLFDAFDGMLDMSRRRPLIFNLSLHPYLIGHAHRLKPFTRFLEHLVAHRREIWITTPERIVDHVDSLIGIDKA